MSDTISVLIVDDQALLRGGFKVLIDSVADMATIGEAANGADAVEQARSLHPDVVLMDVRMPRMDGIEATHHITADPSLAGTRVLILTTFDHDEYVYEAIRAGASGFLLKDTSPEELLTAIRVVAGGDALLSPSVTRRLLHEFASRVPPRPANHILDVLTARELEVLTEIARGLQRRDRHSPSHQRRHDQNPRQPDPQQAQRPRPGAARCDLLRDRPGHAGLKVRLRGHTSI